jgi:hypothetical protein
VFALTLGILAIYWAFLQATTPQVRFAETDLSAGLIRLQELQQTKGPAAFIAGTSISARLQADVIFDGFSGAIVNMGIEGASPLFAARQILESAADPKVVVLETNYILVPPDSNTQLLDDISESPFFRLAPLFSPLRREYRPVTLLYSRLKTMRDSQLTREMHGERLAGVRVTVEEPTTCDELPAEQVALARTWAEVIKQLKERRSTILLAMVPDGDEDRVQEYRFARFLAVQYQLPLVDLKGSLAGHELVYSDGLHLVDSTAHEVAALMNRVIRERFPMRD